MENNLQTEILDISKLIFDDNDFTKVENYLNKKQYTNLRLFVNEYKEALEICYEVNQDYILTREIEYCNKLEDYTIELSLGQVITN